MKKWALIITENFIVQGMWNLETENFTVGKRKVIESVNLIDAIKKSCDCYFYNLAKEINIDELAEFSNNFLLGV